MLTNSNMLGSYAQVATGWQGGILDMRTHHAAKNKLPNFFGNQTPISDNYGPIGYYQRKFLSTLSQDTSMYNIFMRADGLKLYIVGITSDSVYQYNLSTAYDVTTASYIGAFAFGTTVVDPTGISISSDGTKLFVLGSSADTVYSYTMSTPWEVSSLTYDSKTFSVTTQESTPVGLYVKPDGTKFWVIGGTSDTVFEYTMSSAWNLSTAAYASISFSVTAQDGTPSSISWSGDGLRFFILGRTNDIIFVYQAASAFTVSGATYLGATPAINSMIPVDTVTATSGFYFVPGTKYFYITDTTADKIYQFQTRTTDRVQGEANATLLTNSGAAATLAMPSSTCRSIIFRPDGGKFWISDGTASRIYEYSCSTPWELTGATQTTSHYGVSFSGTTIGAYGRFTISSDGSYYYTTDLSSGTLTQWQLLNPWDPSTFYFVRTATLEASIDSFRFSYDGINFYYTTTTGGTVYQRTLSKAWDISTFSTAVSFTDSVFVGTTNTLHGAQVSQDGHWLYFAGDAAGRIYKYKLTVPFSITGGFTEAHHAYVETITTVIKDMYIKADGSRYYTIDNTSGIICQFNLQSPN